MNRARRSGRYPLAYIPFFAAALIFGAVTIPLWVLAYGGITAACADCDPFARHAHELLFGYALAVVGGFLFTKVGKGALAVAFICWLAARAAVFADLEPTPMTAALALAFPVCVFLFAGLPFLKAARTAHNAVFAPVLGAFMFAELVFQLGSLGWLTEGERRGVYLALDLVTLLLFVMGGRVIPAATAGAVRELGGYLRIRVQPRVEWTGIGALAAVLLCDLLSLAPDLAGLLSMLAGAAALVRLSRWEPWRIVSRPDMWTLHLGYAWLGVGLILTGLARADLALPPGDAVHAITVGALGTLSLAMMARTAMQRGGLPTRFPAAITTAIALMSLSSALRLLAGYGDRPTLVGTAGIVWSAALLLFLAGSAPAFRHALRRHAAAASA
ncbi:MAG: NnrS family protein [Rhodospirillales bacterium]|nr:NnrS family protein [Rhodospirillales bacterium]